MDEQDVSTKVCNKCGIEKPVCEFYVRRPRPERWDNGGLFGHCKVCHNSYTVDRSKSPSGKTVKKKIAREYSLRRREILWKIKTVPCTDCGGEFPPYVMDFDHRDKSQKEFTIAESLNRVSMERLMDEVAKCDVICANCHRIRTHTSKAHMNKAWHEAHPDG